MSVKSKLLSVLLATLLMVSDSVFALIADEIATMQKAMFDEISTIVVDRKTLEQAIDAVSNQYSGELLNEPIVAVAALYGSIADYLSAKGVLVGSLEYQSAFSAASEKMINGLALSEGDVTQAAISADIDVNAVIESLPATPAAGPAQPASPIAGIAANRNIRGRNFGSLISNVASNGSSNAGSPAI